jgi:hypothetical protein
MHNSSTHNGDGDGVQLLPPLLPLGEPLHLFLLLLLSLFVVGHVELTSIRRRKKSGKERKKEKDKKIERKKERGKGPLMTKAKVSSLMVFFFFFSFPLHSKL